VEKARLDFKARKEVENEMDRPLPPDPHPDDSLTEEEAQDGDDEDSSMPSYVKLY
jgi:hypothetical protein